MGVNTYRPDLINILAWSDDKDDTRMTILTAARMLYRSLLGRSSWFRSFLPLTCIFNKHKCFSSLHIKSTVFYIKNVVTSILIKTKDAQRHENESMFWCLISNCPQLVTLVHSVYSNSRQVFVWGVKDFTEPATKPQCHLKTSDSCLFQIS